MTKNEIVKSLLDMAQNREVLKRYCPPECNSVKWTKAICEAAELLKASPEWISVKDKMPEEYKGADDTLINYLCYMPEYGVDIANYMKPAGVWVCMGIPVKITHWMPMPPPPKESEETEL